MKVKANLELPPTSNNIYFNDLNNKGRRLTTEARSWKRRAISEINRQARLGLSEPFEQDIKYYLQLDFYFKQIENKSWYDFYIRGPKKGQRKASTRWKKIDLSNLIKLVEDAVKDAVVVDDSAIFVHFLTKNLDVDNPRVEIEFSPLGET